MCNSNEVFRVYSGFLVGCPKIAMRIFHLRKISYSNTRPKCTHARSHVANQLEIDCTSLVRFLKYKNIVPRRCQVPLVCVHGHAISWPILAEAAASYGGNPAKKAESMAAKIKGVSIV